MPSVEIPWLYRFEDFPDMERSYCGWCWDPTETVPEYFMYGRHGWVMSICLIHATSGEGLGPANRTLTRGEPIMSVLNSDALLHMQCRECEKWITFRHSSLNRHEFADLLSGGEHFHCGARQCSEGYSICTECQIITHERDGHVCPPREMCQSCYSAMSTRGVYRRAEPFSVFDEYGDSTEITDWCFSCYQSQTFQCAGCEHLHRRDSNSLYAFYRSISAFHRGNDSGYVSDFCAVDAGMWTCANHDAAFPDEEDSEDVQPPCCERDDARDLVHYYSYAPALQFHGEGKLFLGMELEITSNRVVKTAKAAVEGFGDLVYLKDDSSINGDGFEMVTHPMSYAWALEHVDWSTLDRMRASGGYEHSSCGIHVHASREGFSGPAHDYRWMTFFDRNSNQLSTLARRQSSRYAAWGQKTAVDKRVIATKKPIRRRGGGCDCRECSDVYTEGTGNRYQAINPTNPHTYEVRIFATSLNQQEVRAALGLVHATIEYTRTLRARDVLHDKGLTWGAFVKWLTPRTEYADLMAEITKYNLTGE